MRVDRPTDWQIKNNSLLLVPRSPNLVVTTRYHQLKELKRVPTYRASPAKLTPFGNAEYQGWRDILYGTDIIRHETPTTSTPTQIGAREM